MALSPVGRKPPFRTTAMQPMIRRAPIRRAFFTMHLSMARSLSRQHSPEDKPANIIADFRRLKFTHNSTHVLDEVTGTRKLRCEVFFPLPLTIAESHCTRLSGSSVRV